MNAPEECVPFDRLPFNQVKEYIDPESGKFYAIGKPQVIHVAIASKFQGTEQAVRVIQMCTRIDERPLTENEVWNMDMHLFNKLLELITSK